MKKFEYWLMAVAIGWGVGTPVQAQPRISRPNLVVSDVVHPVEPHLSPYTPQPILSPALLDSSVVSKAAIQLEECPILPVKASELVNAYANELEARLKNKSTGFAFVVRYRDTAITAERAGGAARQAPDRNPRSMSVNERLNIASVSKIITAATLLKLMTAKKYSLETPVCDLLPADWTIGTNFETVTVRELLTHHSGIRFPNQTTIDNLKTGIEQGILLPDKAVFSYNNSNFGLMRIIIARLVVNDFNPAGPTAGEEFGLTYISAVNRQIFRPAGLSDIRCQPDMDSPAQCYQFPTNKTSGTDFGNTSEYCGALGWNMSAKELSTVGSKLFFSSTNAIMPCQQVEDMINGELGIFNDMLTPTVAEFGHNGYYPGKDANGNVAYRGEMNSLLLGFSNGISVALLVNSQLSSDITATATAKLAMATTLGKIVG